MLEVAAGLPVGESLRMELNRTDLKILVGDAAVLLLHHSMVLDGCFGCCSIHSRTDLRGLAVTGTEVEPVVTGTEGKMDTGRKTVLNFHCSEAPQC